MAKQGIRASIVKWVLNSLGIESLADLLGGGYRSASGQTVNDETALKIAAFLSCIKVISETLASLPLQVFKRTAQGKAVAADHPLYALLAYRPNGWQTSLEFREMMITHCLMRGNAYAVKLQKYSINAGKEYTSELIPLHPDRVTVTQHDNLSLTYDVSLKNGETKTYTQDQIFHLRAWSTNGFEGRSLIADARETLGKSLGMQEYSSRFFAADATPGIMLKHPTKLSDAAYKRLKESFDSRHAGSSKSHETAILEEGMSIEKLSFSAQDSQFIESVKLTRSEIAGLCRVPPHLIGDLDRATFSNIEEQNISFVAHCIRPWAVRWEQALSRDLFTAPLSYFPEHNLEGLLRGNIQSRYQAYAIGRMWGWLSANDIRRRENENDIGAEGDVYLTPTNMASAELFLKTMGDKNASNQ